MFGIGTNQLQLDQFKFHFVSALGSNQQSWGLSYHGKLQHNGVSKDYAPKFSQGCIVGVYLDLNLGILEFYLNRRSLGVAYTNIPINYENIKFYPMICSTAAKSVVRLLNCVSLRDTLQLRAFKVLSKNSALLRELQQLPSLNHLYISYWFFAAAFEITAKQLAEANKDALNVRRARKTKFKGTCKIMIKAHKKVRLCFFQFR